jgi:hypothetical protein
MEVIIVIVAIGRAVWAHLQIELFDDERDIHRLFSLAGNNHNLFVSQNKNSRLGDDPMSLS